MSLSVTPSSDFAGVGPVTTVDAVNAEPLQTVPLAAALAGDRDAWDQIVSDYTNLLWWIARSFRLDDPTAADVVQTVWLQLLRAGSRISDPNKLPAWLATTARRESMRRTSTRDIPAGDIDDEIDRLASEPDENLLNAETIGIVLAAFKQLSEEDQRLLRLVCAVPPKTYEEVAVLLGKSHGHIGPSRQRALARLRTHLRKAGLL